MRLTLSGRQVGSGVTDSAGRFEVPFAAPDLDVGRYDVVAACDITLTTPIDVVVSVGVSGTSGVAVMLFIVIGLGLIGLRQAQIGLLDGRPPLHELQQQLLAAFALLRGTPAHSSPWEDS